MSLKARSKHNSPKNHIPTPKQRPEHATRAHKKPFLQTGGVLLSLAGVLACNYLGLGLGRVVCHGLLVASLGSPLHRAAAPRARV